MAAPPVDPTALPEFRSLTTFGQQICRCEKKLAFLEAFQTNFEKTEKPLTFQEAKEIDPFLTRREYDDLVAGTNERGVDYIKNRIVVVQSQLNNAKKTERYSTPSRPIKPNLDSFSK